MSGIHEKVQALGEERERRRNAARERTLDSRRMYCDVNGDPQPLPSFVVYLDALGTKAAMEVLNDTGLRAQVNAMDHLNWHLHDPGWDYHPKGPCRREVIPHRISPAARTIIR